MERSGPHHVTNIRSRVSVVLDDDGISRHIGLFRIRKFALLKYPEDSLQETNKSDWVIQPQMKTMMKQIDIENDEQMNINNMHHTYTTTDMKMKSKKLCAQKMIPLKRMRTIILVRHSNREKRRPVWQHEFVMN